MCRTVPAKNFDIKCNTKLQAKIKKEDPQAFAKRQQELKRDNKFNGDYHDLKVIYGNRHELISPKGVGRTENNNHKWTMFVEFANKKLDPTRLISKVRFGLDESYGIDYMDIKAPK